MRICSVFLLVVRVEPLVSDALVCEFEPFCYDLFLSHVGDFCWLSCGYLVYSMSHIILVTKLVSVEHD